MPRALGLVTRVVRAADSEADAATDRELLRRFADAQDEAAFAALAARHAPMVLGVCRRLLPTAQDAEDACQATFLLLVRKASGLRGHTSVAGWLYTTARQVAAKAHRTAARRQRREARAATPATVSTLDEITGRELLAVLDEELRRLPARYREPLVLCALEGLSRDEAAAHLGVPPATLKTRLERGRRALEAALTRRGVGLGVLALAVVTPAAASQLQLLDSIRMAVSGSPPAAVLTLAKEASVISFRTALAAGMIAVAAAGVGLGWSATGPAAEVDAPPAVPVSTAPVAQPVAAADAALQAEVTAARAKAIRFLKGQQTQQGNWEGVAANVVADMEGGATALATLALQEAGVPADDPTVTKAVAYLAALPPKKTYVVSLQTQVLTRANPKAHAARIQANADWLLEKAIGWKKSGRIDGWSYPASSIGDGSNTHFAVIALDAAARAGAKVDPAVWPAVRDHYVRTRLPRGWSYSTPFAPPTESMTAAALVGLALAAKHEKAPAAAVDAIDKGMQSFLDIPAGSRKSSGYQWLVTAELGRALGSPVFRSGQGELQWYKGGVGYLLKTQHADGSWAEGTGIDRVAVLTTACGLYFLCPPAGADGGAPPKPEKKPDTEPAAVEPVWGKLVDGLRLGIHLAKDRVSVALENVDPNDLVLNVGLMLGNGRKQLPTAIKLRLTDTAGNTRVLERNVGGIAGRVDPFVVPLPAGGRYTLACALSDYIDTDPAKIGVPLAAGAYRVSATFVGTPVEKGNTSGLALMTYWTETVTSGETKLTIPAKP